MDNSLLNVINAQLPELRNEDTLLYFNELKELKKRKFKKILEQQYKLETLGKMMISLKGIEEKNNEQLRIKTAQAHNNLYLFITINPKPSIELDFFKKKIFKLVSRRLFDNCLYVFEQRGTTVEEAGKGFHCHILAQRNLNYKPFKVTECIKNSVKTLVNLKNCTTNLKKGTVLNVQYIGEEFAKDKREYLLGSKTGEGKDKKQEIDVIWRQKNNLKVYYNNAQDS